jgi:recombinational DNA repair protein RecR
MRDFYLKDYMFKRCCGTCNNCWYIGNPITCTCPDEYEKEKHLIKSDEDDEFDRIERENNLKGQPYIYKSKWNSISDDDIARLSVECSLVTPSDFYFARAIETKLKELNS